MRIRSVFRLLLISVATFGVLLLGPLSVWMFGDLDKRGTWWSASRASTGLSPKPADESRAVVQVFAARTLRWRGAFAVHSWIATKRTDADHYTVHHVIGWRYYSQGQSVVSGPGVPDFQWFGAVPDLLADHRGPKAEAMIGQIEQVVANYRYDRWYRPWPGPNSNTFVAIIAREVPELQVELPPTAIGKDYLGEWRLLASAPSGTGWQLSLAGLFGITLAWEEGIELNVLGLSVGIDFNDLRLRLPGLGFVGIDQIS